MNCRTVDGRQKNAECTVGEQQARLCVECLPASCISGSWPKCAAKCIGQSRTIRRSATNGAHTRRGRRRSRRRH